MNKLKNKRVALVYDRINKWGGAERILLALHEIFPDAPLFTSVYNPSKAMWANVFKVNSSFLQNIPFASNHHEYLPMLMPLAFESFSFDEYDLVISVTSESAKGIIAKPHTLHICYCLTPTRYLWSGFDNYFSNKLLRTLSKPAVKYLKNWDLIAAKRPDKYIAISKEVQKRINKYYDRESEVIYPPSGILGNSFEISGKMQKQKQDYFLVVSRLVSYKHIDLAVKACNELKVPLLIIGNGSEERKLRSIAGPTIKFIGYVDDAKLAQYYHFCRALIFPGHEDFGLTMVETLSFGKPVIAYKAGGALEIVTENKSGIFFTMQTVEALKKAIREFEDSIFNAQSCKKQANKFSVKAFNDNFINTVESLL